MPDLLSVLNDPEIAAAEPQARGPSALDLAQVEENAEQLYQALRTRTRESALEGKHLRDDFDPTGPADLYSIEARQSFPDKLDYLRERFPETMARINPEALREIHEQEYRGWRDYRGAWESASRDAERVKAGERPFGFTRPHVEVFRTREAESAAKSENLAYCLLYTSPSPRDRQRSRMPSSA